MRTNIIQLKDKHKLDMTKYLCGEANTISTEWFALYPIPPPKLKKDIKYCLVKLHNVCYFNQYIFVSLT